MFKKWYDFPLWACFVDGAGDSGNDDNKGDNKDDNKGTDNADDSGKKSDGSDDNKKADSTITFPDQATFMGRVDRESKKQLEETAKELGYESAEQMKAAAKAAKDAAEKNKSDLEKEKERADKAEQANQQLKTDSDTRLVSSELKVLAVQAGFVDPADAVALVDRSEVVVDEKGMVTGAKEAIEALAKAKPHLVGQPNRQVGSPGSPGGDGLENLSEEEQGKKIAEDRQKAKEAAKGVEDPWAASK